MMKKIISICLAVMLVGSVCGCAAKAPAASKKTMPELTETEIPEQQWQLDATFPDWMGYVSSDYAANNHIDFISYEDQGEIYLKVEEPCSGCTLYVNGQEVPTTKIEAGHSYKIDISGITVNGRNALQVSDVTEGSVHVMIPYPTVIEGTLEDAGISPLALDLIDRIITADIENGFSSAQLAIIKDGKLVYEKAWGQVRTYDEQGNPVDAPLATTETLYDLASNTKMYSANYAIQYLLDQGMIHVEDKIVDILGEGFAADTIAIDYEGYDPIPLETNKEWKASLTIRDLMTHQGGFPAGPQYFNDRYDCATQYFDAGTGNATFVGTGADEAAREETLRQIFRTPLMYEPGTKTMYSDVDFMILCYCVEKITGKRMDQFLDETFFEPMGLAHITYNPLQHGFQPEDCAATEVMGNSRDGHLGYTGVRTYTLQGEVHDPNAWYCMAGISGHAGLFSNATDLAKLASVMLTGGYGGHRFFSQNVIDLVSAPKSEYVPWYGLGWWRQGVHEWDNYFSSVSSSHTIGHQGFTGTLTVIDPEEDMVIVFLTNRIHSTLVEGDETLNGYKGTFYTTSSLGFVTDIIQVGLDDKANQEAIYASLVRDMAADCERKIADEEITDENHPRMKTYQALCKVRDSYEEKK